MNQHEPIKLDELQGDRSLNEWEIWLRSRLGGLSSKYKRFNKGPMKVVKEEIIPTLNLLRRGFKGQEIFAAFPANNSTADALIRPASAAKATPLQITCNLTHSDHQRLQILHRDGMAPGAGPITRVDGRLEAKNQAYFMEEVVDELAISIIHRLNLKAQKFGNYDPSTWLLIYIEDGRLLLEWLPILLQKVQNAAAKSPFVATFLVGSTDQEICEIIGGRPKWAS